MLLLALALTFLVIALLIFANPSTPDTSNNKSKNAANAEIRIEDGTATPDDTTNIDEDPSPAANENVNDATDDTNGDALTTTP